MGARRTGCRGAASNGYRRAPRRGPPTAARDWRRRCRHCPPSIPRPALGRVRGGRPTRLGLRAPGRRTRQPPRHRSPLRPHSSLRFESSAHGGNGDASLQWVQDRIATPFNPYSRCCGSPVIVAIGAGSQMIAAAVRSGRAPPHGLVDGGRCSRRHMAATSGFPRQSMLPNARGWSRRIATGSGRRGAGGWTRTSCTSARVLRDARHDRRIEGGDGLPARWIKRGGERRPVRHAAVGPSGAWTSSSEVSPPPREPVGAHTRFHSTAATRPTPQRESAATCATWGRCAHRPPRRSRTRRANRRLRVFPISMFNRPGARSLAQTPPLQSSNRSPVWAQPRDSDARVARTESVTAMAGWHRRVPQLRW